MLTERQRALASVKGELKAFETSWGNMLGAYNYVKAINPNLLQSDEVIQRYAMIRDLRKMMVRCARTIDELRTRRSILVKTRPPNPVHSR